MTALLARRERRRRALARQVAHVERRLTALRELGDRLSWARLLLFVGGIAVSGALFFLHGPAAWLLAATVWLAPFAAVVAYHRRIDAAVRRHTLWRDVKQTHLARMALDWSQLAPPAPLPEPPSTHPFARDLDLSGERSLHHLLDTAVTVDGSLRLQQRLLEEQPDRTLAAQRQALVRALAPLSHFRDRLALQALLARREGEGSWRAETLMAWVKSAAGDEPRDLRRWVLGLALLGAANLILLLVGQSLALAPGLALYFLLYFLQSRAAGSLFAQALALQDALQQMAIVFRFLERARYHKISPLRALLAPFHGAGESPSRLLRSLSRIVAAAGLSRNAVLWLALNLFFPWDLFFTYRLQQLRGDIAARLPTWLDAWFELECAAALANLAFLNPQFTFPSFRQPGEEGAPFTARELGHPLIVTGGKVRNDYTIAARGQVHIITGSNMAGKSSFLRTLGVNLCLAYAGGPVDAASMHTDFFRLYTAIRVADSVTDGISYFYAEVKRLKGLLETLEQPAALPLFFLIDEIFRGTNNRERLLGSRAYIRSLVGQNGLGLIATHDLELVQLAEEMPQVFNFHFRDSVRDGRMVFDYRLRPGPSPTTNALKVMASAGLPVPPQSSDSY